MYFMIFWKQSVRRNQNKWIQQALTMSSCCQRRGPGRGAPGPPASFAPLVSTHPRGGRELGRLCGTLLPGASLGQLSVGKQRVRQAAFNLCDVSMHQLMSHQSRIGGVASALCPHQVQGFQGWIVIRCHPASWPGPATHHWQGTVGYSTLCTLTFSLTTVTGIITLF